MQSQRSMFSNIGSKLILRSKLDTDRYGRPRQNLLLVLTKIFNVHSERAIAMYSWNPNRILVKGSVRSTGCEASQRHFRA